MYMVIGCTLAIIVVVSFGTCVVRYYINERNKPPTYETLKTPLTFTKPILKRDPLNNHTPHQYPPEGSYHDIHKLYILSQINAAKNAYSNNKIENAKSDLSYGGSSIGELQPPVPAFMTTDSELSFGGASFTDTNVGSDTKSALSSCSSHKKDPTQPKPQTPPPPPLSRRRRVTWCLANTLFVDHESPNKVLNRLEKYWKEADFGKDPLKSSLKNNEATKPSTRKTKAPRAEISYRVKCMEQSETVDAGPKSYISIRIPIISRDHIN